MIVHGVQGIRIKIVRHTYEELQAVYARPKDASEEDELSFYGS